MICISIYIFIYRYVKVAAILRSNHCPNSFEESTKKEQNNKKITIKMREKWESSHDRKSCYLKMVRNKNKFSFGWSRYLCNRVNLKHFETFLIIHAEFLISSKVHANDGDKTFKNFDNKWFQISVKNNVNVYFSLFSVNTAGFHTFLQPK